LLLFVCVMDYKRWRGGGDVRGFCLERTDTRRSCERTARFGFMPTGRMTKTKTAQEHCKLGPAPPGLGRSSTGFERGASPRFRLFGHVVCRLLGEGGVCARAAFFFCFGGLQRFCGLSGSGDYTLFWVGLIVGFGGLQMHWIWFNIIIFGFPHIDCVFLSWPFYAPRLSRDLIAISRSAHSLTSGLSF